MDTAIALCTDPIPSIAVGPVPIPPSLALSCSAIDDAAPGHGPVTIKIVVLDCGRIEIAALDCGPWTIAPRAMPALPPVPLPGPLSLSYVFVKVAIPNPGPVVSEDAIPDGGPVSSDRVIADCGPVTSEEVLILCPDLVHCAITAPGSRPVVPSWMWRGGEDRVCDPGDYDPPTDTIRVYVCADVWSMIPVDLSPGPDAVFPEDSWHPWTDWYKWRSEHPGSDRRRSWTCENEAPPTEFRAEYFGNGNRAPAGNASKETLLDLKNAYESLPHPEAIVSIIMAHLGLLHTVVGRIREANGMDYATGADLFSAALIKLWKMAPKLKRLGERNCWDGYDFAQCGSRYIGQSVRRALWERLREKEEREKKAEDWILEYLGTHHSYARAKRTRDDEPDAASCDGNQHVLIDEKPPDLPVRIKEAVDRACRDEAKRRLFRMREKGLSEEEKERLEHDACVNRQLLELWEEGILTQTQIGKEVGLHRDQVRRRLRALLKLLATRLGLDPEEDAAKRSSRLRIKPAQYDSRGKDEDDPGYAWLRLLEDMATRAPPLRDDGIYRGLPFYRWALPDYRVSLFDPEEKDTADRWSCNT